MRFDLKSEKILKLLRISANPKNYFSGNREIEIALNRIYFCIIFGFIFYAIKIYNYNSYYVIIDGLIRTNTYYCFVAMLIFIHLCSWREASSIRKLLGICVDVAAISSCMVIGGEYFTIGYVLYLWVIFGNGLRFGNSYLILAMMLSLVGGTCVVIFNPFWNTHLFLVGGLLSGLIMLPLYAFYLVKKLSAALAAAEEANRAKSLFIASVSHELRTPLTSIIGLGELLQNTNLSSDQDNMVRTISSAGRSLLRMINSVINIAKAEDKHNGVLSEKIDVYQLLSDIRAMLSVQAAAKETRLVVEINPTMPQYIQANFRHLEEILLNLVGNAVKFTTRGSVRVLMNAKQLETGRLRLRCDIYDTGIGIAPEHQSRIFERFTQANDSILSQFGGSGLGLAIARQLVELYNGVIGVDSALDQGSHFWFEMDAAAVQSPGVRGDVQPSTEILYPDTVPQSTVPAFFKILVAEDNLTNQKIISKILSLAGHEVKAVDNGELALEALLNEHFDIALMDINMPVMTGLEATQLYHFSATGPVHTPIVALTADVSDHTRRNCLDAGIKAFCTKPIETERLMALIEQIVRTYPVPQTESAPRSGLAVQKQQKPPAPQKPYLDPAPLANLARIGGDDFCTDIITEFLEESSVLAQAIQTALVSGDLIQFHQNCHALQSCAGNIGAMRLSDLMLQWQAMREREFQETASELLKQFQAEMNTIRNILVNRSIASGQAIAI